MSIVFIEELKNNKEYAVKAVKQNGNALQYVLDELKGDREIVLEAVKQNGNALQYVSDELKGDREIVLEAVKQNGNALQYALDELTEDREIILEAIKQDVSSLKYASDDSPDFIAIFLLSIKYGLCVLNTLCFCKFCKSGRRWDNNLSCKYNKSFDELERILIESKLTLKDAGAKVFTINKEVNENTISMISMDGAVYTINNIDKDITFNRLADELYKIDNSHNNIAFINNKGETFDLSNFNESVVESI